MPDYPLLVESFLSRADVQINGDNPWDIHVHHPGFYKRAILERTIGMGEAFMDGWWTCDQVDELFCRLAAAQINQKFDFPLHEKVKIFLSGMINLQTRPRSQKVIREHYNLQSDVILSCLDAYKQYSCGYFKETDDLEVAQQQKLEMICSKLDLSSQDRVLDIGCGYGGFAKYAAEKYHCEVVGITPSDRQTLFAKEFCQGLPVSIIQKDYRDFQGQFSKIVSVGMVEHVGYKNYRTLIEKVHDCLEDGGLFLLQTIGGHESVTTGDAWLMKYIFPNSMLPSASQLTRAAEGLFTLEDVHNFGSDYHKTLMAWHQNFVREWPRFNQSLDENFFRMWSYYLQHFAGTFKARMNQLWQFVFSKCGRSLSYNAIR